MKPALTLLLMILAGNPATADVLSDDSLSGASVLTDEEASDTALTDSYLPISDNRREEGMRPNRKELISTLERLRIAEVEAARKAPQLTVNAER